MIQSELDAMAQDRRDDEAEIERIMDKYTWDGFITMLTTIAAEKSEHVRSTWQDKAAAKEWMKVHNAFAKLRNFDPYGV